MFASPIFLQAATATAGSGGSAAMIMNIVPFIGVIAAFYFLMLRPQQRRAKMLQDMLGGMKKGDEVVTAGGHIGKVFKVDDKEVEVEFSAGQRHRVVKATIVEVRPLGGGKPAND